MSHALPRALVALAASLALAFVVSGCSSASSSEGEVGAVATAGTASAALAIQAGSMFITIENRAGQPLLDVRVAIQGGRAPFTAVIPRLETSQKVDLTFGDFRARDGTPFSLRVARPRAVVATAQDFVGQKHEVTVPWER